MTKIFLLGLAMMSTTQAFAAGRAFVCVSEFGTISITKDDMITLNLKAQKPELPKPLNLTLSAPLRVQDSTNGREDVTITVDQNEGGLRAGDRVATDQQVFFADYTNGQGQNEQFWITLSKRNVTHDGSLPILDPNYTANITGTGGAIDLNSFWDKEFKCAEFAK